MGGGGEGFEDLDEYTTNFNKKYSGMFMTEHSCLSVRNDFFNRRSTAKLDKAGGHNKEVRTFRVNGFILNHCTINCY